VGTNQRGRIKNDVHKAKALSIGLLYEEKSKFMSNIHTGIPSRPSHVRLWAKKRPGLTALIAIQIASISDELIQWFAFLNPAKKIWSNVIFDHDKLSQPPSGDIAKWLSLYKDHKTVLSVTMREVFNHIPGIDNLVKNIMDVSSPVQLQPPSRPKFSTIKPTTKDILADKYDVFDMFDQQTDQLISDWELSLKENTVTEADHEKMLQAWRNFPEVQFFFRVWVPCLFDKGMLPAECLRKARDPNWRKREPMLKYLLSLDKAVLYDPKIATLLREESLKMPYSRSATLSNWIGSPPSTPKDEKTITYLLWALIHMSCENMYKELKKEKKTCPLIGNLTHEQIYNLFCAMHKDRGPDNIFPIDEYTPDVKRMIARHKKTICRFTRTP